MLSNPGGSVQWPKGRHAHSSVLIKNSTGSHLLVVGGMGTNDSWLFDINKRIWKQLVIIIMCMHDFYNGYNTIIEGIFCGVKISQNKVRTI